MLQGIKALTTYKDTDTPADSSDSTLPDNLKWFFARFDQHNSMAHTHPALQKRVSAPIQLQQHQVRTTLCRVSVWKDT